MRHSWLTKIGVICLNQLVYVARETLTVVVYTALSFFRGSGWQFFYLGSPLQLNKERLEKVYPRSQRGICADLPFQLLKQ